MKCLVVYESIWGNTRDVASAIADELGATHAVTAREVASAPTELGEFDLVVVGGPSHAWAMTRESTRSGARDEARRGGVDPVSGAIGVREWLEALAPARPGQAAAAFDTAAHAPFPIPHGSAARPEARRVEARGFRVVAPPEHFFVDAKEGPLSAGELDRARVWARAVAEAAR
jgi:hypothetical protein